MIFYDCSTAPSPRRARILLNEKKVPHTTVNIDIMQGEQLEKEFRLLNPDCTVPVLKLDDGTVLTRNAGITAYLESEFPEIPMLGKTSVEKGLIANWTVKIEFDALMAIADAFRNMSPAMKNRALTGSVNYDQIPALAERALDRVNLFFDFFEAHLEGREFVATDDFSYADIIAAVTIEFARIIKIKPNDNHPNIVRWRNELAQRPSMNL